MITKEITICNTPVTLAYCFATEIAYKELAEEEIHDFLRVAFTDVQNQKMPDVKRTIMLIVACMMAYYEDADKAPISDSYIMKNASPTDLGTVLGTIITLYSEFYRVPKGEPEEKPQKGKKAKNA